MKLEVGDVEFGSNYLPTIKIFSNQRRLVSFPCSYESLVRDESARRWVVVEVSKWHYA